MEIVEQSKRGNLETELPKLKDPLVHSGTKFDYSDFVLKNVKNSRANKQLKYMASLRSGNKLMKQFVEEKLGMVYEKQDISYDVEKSKNFASMTIDELGGLSPQFRPEQSFQSGGTLQQKDSNAFLSKQIGEKVYQSMHVKQRHTEPLQIPANRTFDHAYTQEYLAKSRTNHPENIMSSASHHNKLVQKSYYSRPPNTHLVNPNTNCNPTSDTNFITRKFFFDIPDLPYPL
ncbi:hypothetical protein BB561_001724 [Smittium simulii]|uniref:Uncharacterized protein n=1 Tax=Smittium simulii TaxID=133385 RepID=A0A2T9YTI1_9FUNG|nr:hypothetical protein BB561_001724 [Smittium simulii]